MYAYYPYSIILIKTVEIILLQAIYYTSTSLYGLGIGFAVTTILAVVSDLCSVNQLPLLFGIECFSEGLGGLALIPVAGKPSVEEFSLCEMLCTFLLFFIVISLLKIL